MLAVGSREGKCKEDRKGEKMYHHNKTKDILRSGWHFLIALCMQILALWIALGDAILEFAASYVKVLDDICFHGDFGDTPEDSNEELDEFRQDLLDTHNHCRSLHGCPALEMSMTLTNSAQAWANKLANRGMLLYSENQGIGETIFVMDLDKDARYSKGEHITREWYSEIDNYDYSNPKWNSGSFRATQLLWKESRKMGVGKAKVPGQNRFYVVVQYRPAGNSNLPGKFQRNVPPRRRS